MKIQGRKSYNLSLMDELMDFFIFVESLSTADENVYLVLKGEDKSGIFNMGGDLKYFLDKVYYKTTR